MGWIHGPWMVQPRSPVTATPCSRDVPLTTSCHQGSQQLALLPSTSLDRARSLHRTCTLGASTSLWVERNLPIHVCACAVFHFWGFRRRNPFTISPLSWQSHLLLLYATAVTGNAVLSVKDMALTKQTRALSMWGTYTRVPRTAKYPCCVLWRKPPPPQYTLSILSGGRKCLPKTAFCCLP